MSKLKGRVAVVTAGGSGMGRDASLGLAEEGAAVVVADLDLAAAEAVAKEIADAGGTARAFEIDVSKVAQIAALYDYVDREFGVLHVVFNHAGIPGPAGLDLTEEQFDSVVDINLKSQFFGTSLAVPLLEKGAPHASIIYTSSTSGLQGSPNSPIYGATKWATLGLMRSVAKRLGPLGIRANAVCPGPTDTPMLRVFTDAKREGLSEEDYQADLERRSGQIPLRRPGNPRDVANAVVFLASDDSSFITGTTLPVDGGILA